MEVAHAQTHKLYERLYVVNDSEYEANIFQKVKIAVWHSMIRHGKHNHVANDHEVNEYLKCLRLT